MCRSTSFAIPRISCKQANEFRERANQKDSQNRTWKCAETSPKHQYEDEDSKEYYRRLPGVPSVQSGQRVEAEQAGASAEEARDEHQLQVVFKEDRGEQLT